MEASEIDRWNEAQAIFDTVLETPGEKSLLTARMRAVKSGCTVELDALIAAMDTASALDLPLDEAIYQMSAERLQVGALSGRVFGRWTLGEEIGRGGMSTVYHAQRTGDGFEQHAALKILSLTFASQPLIYSFLRERQILSELQHPPGGGGVGTDCAMVKVVVTSSAAASARRVACIIFAPSTRAENSTLEEQYQQPGQAQQPE